MIEQNLPLKYIPSFIEDGFCVLTVFFYRSYVKRLTKELSQIIQQVQDFLKNMDVAVWSFENDLQKFVCNSEAFFKITGYAPDTIIDWNSWINLIHPEDLPIFEASSAIVLQGLQHSTGYRIIRSNGDIRWIEVKVEPFMDNIGYKKRLEGILIDVTPLKEALYKSELRYKSLIDKDYAVDRFEESETMYRLIAENTTDMVRIVEVNGKTIYASPSHLKLLGYSPEQYIEQDIFTKMIHPEDTEMIIREFMEMVASKQPRCVQFRVTHANGELRYFEEYGTPVVRDDGKIEHIIFVARDITDKKLTELALEESEAKYRLIAENMTDLIGVVDIHGKLLYVSKRGLGYDDKCMIGTSGFDYVFPEDNNFVREQFIEIIRSKTNALLNFRFIHADGHTIYSDCMATPVLKEDGEVKSIVIVSRDITDRVQIERELKESEDRYQRLIELSPKPIATHRDGVFTYINPSGVRFLGATGEHEIVGKSIYERVHPDYKEMAKERVKLVIEEKYVDSIEYKMIRLDGQTIEAEIIGIYDDTARSVIAIFNDISERKKMEIALRESEERYRRVVELSPVAITIYKDDRFTYINPSGMKVIGAEKPEDFIGTNALEWVHPIDKDIVREFLKNRLPFDYTAPREYKIIRLDGKEIDVSLISVYDSQSDSVQFAFEDITARKEAERALSESEELSRRLVELSPEAIVLHCDFKFKYVNTVGLKLFGASSMSELKGKNILDYIHPDFKEETSMRLSAIYDLHSATSIVEQKLIRYDGSIIDVDIISAPLSHRGINSGLTMIRDVTDRRIVEEERRITEQIIRESEDRYCRLQTSLDRFSHDLLGVMKVEEIETRLIKEIQDITRASTISILEVDQNNHAVIRNGNRDIGNSLMRDILELNLKELPFCEIIEIADGYIIKLIDIKEHIHLLCFNEKPPFLKIKPKCIWLKTITRYVSVLYDNFRLIEDLTKELEQNVSLQVAPSWLLRLLFRMSENERKRLSQDLHDAALQEQIIWYRKLDQMLTDPSVTPDLRVQLQQITNGLLDVVYQIRITCNELRPPMLKEEGLVSSLEALFEFTQLRADYAIQFEINSFRHALDDELLIGLYRIVQELLANASKHSKATQVHITLFSRSDGIELTYKDNGIGMDLSVVEDSFKSMGVYGMKERVRSMDGRIDFHSIPDDDGLAIHVFIPTHLTERNSN